MMRCIILYISLTRLLVLILFILVMLYWIWIMLNRLLIWIMLHRLGIMLITLLKCTMLRIILRLLVHHTRLWVKRCNSWSQLLILILRLKMGSRCIHYSNNINNLIKFHIIQKYFNLITSIFLISDSFWINFWIITIKNVIILNNFFKNSYLLLIICNIF